MKKRSEYLVARVINDRFIALDYRNNLISWSIVSGKRLHKMNI